MVKLLVDINLLNYQSSDCKIESIESATEKMSMKRLSILVVLVLASCILSGCNGQSFKFANVAGRVQLDGKPVAGVGVTFCPQPTQGTAVVGPPSFGITDSSGKFVLASRNGNKGAIVGTHKVYCQFENFDPEIVHGIMLELAEARQNNEDTKRIETRLDDALSQKSIRNGFELAVKVADTGLLDYKIELSTNDQKGE